MILLGGIVFQLALLFITGNGLYTICMVENVIVMKQQHLPRYRQLIVINYCADPIHRSADRNPTFLIVILWMNYLKLIMSKELST